MELRSIDEWASVVDDSTSEGGWGAQVKRKGKEARIKKEARFLKVV